MTIKLTGLVLVSVESAEQVISRTAGEAIPAKAAVCLGESDGKVYKAKADSSTTMPAVGITKESVSAGSTAKIYQSGIVTNVLREADFSPDDMIFVSPVTAGKVTKTPPETLGHFVQTMGRALNSSDIVLEVGRTYTEIGS
jgi:hypothetical protein